MDTFKLHDIINISVYNQDRTWILPRFLSHNDESFCHIRVCDYNKRANYTCWLQDRTGRCQKYHVSPFKNDHFVLHRQPVCIA